MRRRTFPEAIPALINEQTEHPPSSAAVRYISNAKLAAMHQAIKESIVKTARDYYDFVHAPEECSPLMRQRFERIEREGWPQKDAPEIAYDTVRKVFASLSTEKLDRKLAALADRFKFIPEHKTKEALEVYNDVHDGYTVNIPDSFKPSETQKTAMDFPNAVMAIFNATMREAAEYKMYNEGIHVERAIPEEIKGGIVLQTCYGFSDAADLVKFVNALLPLGKEFPPINSAQINH